MYDLFQHLSVEKNSTLKKTRSTTALPFFCLIQI